jgi:hypothetical protein
VQLLRAGPLLVVLSHMELSYNTLLIEQYHGRMRELFIFADAVGVGHFVLSSSLFELIGV